MSKYEFSSSNFRITHTVEKTGPHITNSFDYYEDTFVITAVIFGSGACYIEGNCYPLNEGDIILLSPNDIHSFKFNDDSSHERISLYLPSEFLTYFNEYALSLWQLFSVTLPQNKYLYKSDDRTKNVLKQIAQIVHSDDISMKDARIHLLILQLLFLLYDSMRVALTNEDDNTYSAVITELCSYIKDHLSEDLSYNRIKEHFLVSQYQLTVKFKEFVGMSLTNYIIAKRLMRVISLVQKGETIESAVFASGFNNYSHFYKQFLRRYGISPKEYFNQNK